MKKSVIVGVNMFFCLIFGLYSNAEAAKLKKADSSFSDIEIATKDLRIQISKIRAYIEEIDKPSSFIKTNFFGIDHAWYSRNLGMANITTEFPIKGDKRKIRDITLQARKQNEWSVYIPIDFKVFYDVGKNLKQYGPMLYGNENPSDKKRWKNNIANKLKKSGVSNENLQEATDYYLQNSNIINKSYLAKIYDDINNLYSNVYYYHGTKKFIGKLSPRNDYLSNHNNFIKENKEILLVKTLQDGYAGIRDVTRGNNSFEDFLAKQKGKLGIKVNVDMHFFVILADSQGDYYGKEEKFLEILDEYVAKGAAVKSIEDDTIYYSDSSSEGKYKGGIAYNKKQRRGAWIPPIWNSKENLKKIKSDYINAHAYFMKFVLSYLDSVYSETVRGLSGSELQDSNKHEF